MGISFPFKSGSGSILIKHLSYGTFQGYDDLAQETSKYSAQDLSLKGSYSKLLNGIPLRAGLSFQLLHSSLNNNELYLLSFSYGAIFLIKKTNLKIGISIHELGSQRFKSKEIYISSKTVFSISKKLNHLPFELLLDFSRSNKKRDQGLTKMVRTVTDFDDFRVGDDVEHSIFGTGKIMALSGTGENQRVGVVFNDGTKKKLIVKYANLKKT